MMHVLCPSVDTVNFQSDGPTTQYRNKKNFFMMAYFSSKSGWLRSSWNFTEAGHGKGQPDGIGGVVKQTADQAVAHGADISSLKDLTSILADQNLKVQVFEIDVEEVKQMDQYLQMNLKAPKNTMKLHQVIWKCSAAHSLVLRELTCIKCGYDSCHHFAMKPAVWIVPSFIDVHESTISCRTGSVIIL